MSITLDPTAENSGAHFSETKLPAEKITISGFSFTACSTETIVKYLFLNTIFFPVLFGDATREVPIGEWNVVVLSNVLEHIEDRVTFLKSLVLTTKAKRYLIRVPMFERDWQMALRRELGIDFRSDSDHRIEHTIKEFRSEIFEAGLLFQEMQTVWGEIWADCRHEEQIE